MSEQCRALDFTDPSPVCTLDVGHEGWHQEWRGGRLWAEWRVDARDHGGRDAAIHRMRGYSSRELGVIVGAFEAADRDGSIDDVGKALHAQIAEELERRVGETR
jgi:hypothetical protein